MANRPPRSRAAVFDHSRSGPNRSATRSAWTYIPRAYNSRIGARSAVGISIRVPERKSEAPDRVNSPRGRARGRPPRAPTADQSLGPLLFPRSAGRVGERAEDVQHVAQLGQPHSVPVQELP